MKHIPENKISSIAADYEDGNFPAENLLDSKPGRKWSAGGVVRNATLTIEVAGGLTDVALFGTNAREASATAEDPCAVTFGENPTMPNLVTNGTFDSDTAWTKGSGWAISGGVASITEPPGVSREIYQGACVTGRKYLARYTPIISSGAVYAKVGGALGAQRLASGTYEETITAINTGGFGFTTSAGSGFTGTVDNVVVYEISADEIAGGDTLKNTTISTTATVYVDETGNALRVSFSPAVSVPCIVSLNATSPGNETLYAGVAVAGTAETYGGANFRYGAGSAPNDYSLTAQNANGSRYYKKRSIGKQYNLTALMLRTEADKLESTIRRQGAIASAWALFDNSTEMIFGWPQLQRSYDHRLYDNITLTITEEI